ncbi:MAG: metallophosphoesterase [Proteobacteria bacterium]|nr:metallophosphoesterase [Pseudomonadota bacterium]
MKVNHALWALTLCSGLIVACSEENPIMMVDPDLPSSPQNPAQPGDPGTDDPAQPGDPGTDDPAQPGKPGIDDPAQPGDPGTDDPAQPGDPGTDDPAQPEDPEQPEDPPVDPDPTGEPDPDPDTQNPGTEVSPIEDDDTKPDDTEGGTDPDVSCPEVCEVGGRRCVDGGSQLCELVNNCPGWGSVTSCSRCDENTGLCLPDCENICQVGQKKCEDNAVWTCALGADQCAAWQQTEACGSEKVCNEAYQCVLGCKDECSENATRCVNNATQTCSKNASGCYVWKAGSACGSGMTCSKDGSKCEYACGNDCKPFSIILIPDTQYYTQSVALDKVDAKGNKVTDSNSIMVKQMEWIAKNKDSKNIRFVMHLGDITNRNREKAWVNSVTAMKKLANASIPFTISTGNHDYYASDSTLLPSRSKSKFSTYYSNDTMKSYFSKSSTLKNMDWFGGYYSGANSYATFSVGNIHFLVFALEFYPRKDVIAWADKILNDPKYADYHVMVTTHGYLKHDAKYCGQQKQAHMLYQVHGMGGKALFNEFIRRHSNIFLVAGGHVSDSEYTTHDNLFGTPVHEILVDYQSENPCQGSLCTAGSCSGAKVNSGNGWLRQLEINPKTGEVKGYTHTAIESDLKYYYGSKDATPHMFCTDYYGKDASKGDHVNNFKIDLSPITHQYSDKNIHGFVPRNVNNVGSGDQFNPIVAMNRTNGNFVVVWEDNSSTDDGTYKDSEGATQNNFDIAFRLFNKGGYANGDQKFVTSDNQFAKGNQIQPDVAMDSKGNFVVVWADDTDNNNVYNIKMSGFDSKGSLRFSNVTVHESASGNQTSPKIAMAPDGRFIVAWNDKQGSSNINVKLRTFNADGKPAAAEQYLIGQTDGTRRNPDIAMDANANYVIVWDDDNDNNGAYQLYARKYDFNGKLLGNVSPVNTESAGQQIHGAVGMNAKGAFFVAYRDDRDKDKKYAIRVRGWDENLKEIITDKQLYNASHNNAQPTVCVDDSNRAVVGFYDPSLVRSVTSDGKTTYDDKSGDVMVATVIGTTIGTALSPTTLVWNNQKQPSVDCTGAGQVVVVYADDADNNGAYELYARGYNKITDIE